jgi:hypothetical protein
VKVFLAQMTKVDHLPPALRNASCGVSSSDDCALGHSENVDAGVVEEGPELFSQTVVEDRAALAAQPVLWNAMRQ